jgi:hypothetical protein
MPQNCIDQAVNPGYGSFERKRSFLGDSKRGQCDEYPVHGSDRKLYLDYLESRQRYYCISTHSPAPNKKHQRRQPSSMYTRSVVLHTTLISIRKVFHFSIGTERLAVVYSLPYVLLMWS